MKKRLSLILALSMILTPLSQAREQSGLLNVKMGGISDQGQIQIN
jgi:uncharacterized protein (DUF2141 family)